MKAFFFHLNLFPQGSRRGQGADKRLHYQGQPHSERRHREVGREDPGRQLLEVRTREGHSGHDKWDCFSIIPSVLSLRLPSGTNMLTPNRGWPFSIDQVNSVNGILVSQSEMRHRGILYLYAYRLSLLSYSSTELTWGSRGIFIHFHVKRFCRLDMLVYFRSVLARKLFKSHPSFRNLRQMTLTLYPLTYYLIVF